MHTDEFRQKMIDLRSNPIAMQQYILQTIEDITEGGIKVMEPSNPFAMLIEVVANASSATMEHATAATRQQYPTLALTENDLYKHMSDEDYLNRFASPSRAPFTMMLSKAEVYNQAVEDNVGTRKLVIPRNSVFRVDNTDFTMVYPIEIRIMPHGGLQIVYNTTLTNPIRTLESIDIDWRIVRYNSQEFISMTVELDQITIQTHYSEMLNSSKFVNYYSFTDNFYYARAFIEQSNGSWLPINTTHSDQVYDPETITAVFKLLDGRLQMSIPSIYFNSNLINRGLRLDIYTTKGPLNMDLSLYSLEEYSARWIDIEKDTALSVFSSPVNTITDMNVFGVGSTVGGKVSLSTESLRKRVIDNSTGRPSIPITPRQLTVVLEDLGYQVITAIDNITDRILQASRPLPAPTSGRTITGAGAMIADLKTSLAQIASTPGVSINGERFTLKPSILYRYTNGILSIVPSTEVAALLTFPTDIRANKVNSDNFYYTPWHYVIDSSQNRMELRAYHLSDPKVLSRNFLEENSKLPLGISARSITITLTDTGFIIDVVTNSSTAFRELADADIQVQLSFAPLGEPVRAYQVGELLGLGLDAEFPDERTYRWNVKTNFNISDESDITLTSFRMIDADTLRLLKAKLVTQFELVFITLNQNTPEALDVALQEHIATFLLPDQVTDALAMVREGFNIQFGHALPNLWIRARTVVEASDYARYTENVPRLHATRVYATDPQTGEPIIEYNTTSQLAEVVVLHEIGDPVTSNGNPVYEHEIGDPILDNDGNPVIAKARDLSRILSLMLIDGRYVFATDDDSVNYRESIAETVVDWLELDIANISDELLEKTQISYFPQRSTGSIEVYDSDNSLLSIDAEQRLNVVLTVPKKVHENLDLRADITKRVIAAVDAELSKSTISSSNIVSTLVALLGSDVYGVVLEGLGGASEVSTMTMKSANSRPVIGKQLQVTSEGKLSVVDDLTVVFVLHKATA